MFNQTFPGTYHQTVATLVKCKGLNPAFFSQTSQEVSSKGHSGSRNNFYVRSDSALNSISKIYPVSSKHNDLNVYKVFSQEPLSSQVLDRCDHYFELLAKLLFYICKTIACQNSLCKFQVIFVSRPTRSLSIFRMFWMILGQKKQHLF